MKHQFTGPGVMITYFLYVVSQTLLLKPYAALTQTLLVILMCITLFEMFRHHQTQWRSTILSSRSFFIGMSTLLTCGLYVELFDLVTIFIKLGYMLAIVTLLESPSGMRTILRTADATLAAVLLVVIAAYANLIPTAVTDFEWFGATKNHVGFYNPNGPMAFIFSALCIYFLLGRGRRFLIASFSLLVLFYLGATSRTYFAAGMLLFGMFLLPVRSGLYHALTYFMFPLFVLMYFVGSIFIFLTAVIPEVLMHIVGSELDILLSLRFETALDYLYAPGETISGFRLNALDTIYYELILLLGPVFWFLLLRAAWRCYKAAKHNYLDFKLLYVVTIIAATGLLETILFSITLGSLILFYVATRSTSNFKTAVGGLRDKPIYYGKIHPKSIPHRAYEF
jgi:hypothetical protein